MVGKAIITENVTFDEKEVGSGHMLNQLHLEIVKDLSKSNHQSYWIFR